MGISFWQIAIVVVLIVLLFGRGKISELMGDVAKGITSFKRGLTEGSDDEDKKDSEKEPPKAISQDKTATTIEGEKAKEHTKS